MTGLAFSILVASLGMLAAGVAHQLNNPLGGITLFTKLILEEYSLEDGGLRLGFVYTRLLDTELYLVTIGLGVGIVEERY